MNHRQEYSYNSRGQNTAVLDANNYTSRAEYDTLGNITKLTGPMGSLINYTYDEMGRLIAETTSSGGSITYGYNALNVKEQLTNARGQVRRYFYDAIGRITGFVGEEDTVSYKVNISLSFSFTLLHPPLKFHYKYIITKTICVQ